MADADKNTYISFNMYIYIVNSVEDLAFMNTFRNSIVPFNNCLKKGNAIVIGGNIMKYTAFSELHSETDITFSDDEGCLIHNGKVTVLKFAKAGIE